MALLPKRGKNFPNYLADRESEARAKGLDLQAIYSAAGAVGTVERIVALDDVFKGRAPAPKAPPVLPGAHELADTGPGGLHQPWFTPPGTSRAKAATGTPQACTSSAAQPTAEIARLKGELAQVQSELTASKAQIETLRADLGQARAAEAQVKATLARERENAQEIADRKAIEIVAAAGGGAVLTVTTDRPARVDKGKSQLHGRARMAAAFRDQMRRIDAIPE